MRDTTSLTILQYNVRNERVRTMIPLLADSNIQDFDVIAIQEPWRNPSVPTTLSSSQSGFHLLYRPGGDTRVCFYVNDKLDTNSWDVEYPTADICTLKLKIKGLGGGTDTVRIHNVYNPSPASYASRDSPSTLSAVLRSLDGAIADHHVLLGDFNLHHPFWSGPTRPTQHAAADELLDIVEKHDLTLTLPKGSITWENSRAASTIDLTFMTSHLADRLEHCMTRPDLSQSSDHIPISTRILCGTEPDLPRARRRAWKLIDLEKVKEVAKNAPTLPKPTSAPEIDEYVEKVQKFLQKVMNEAVPWANPSRYAKSFWSKECDDAVKETRRLRRTWSATQDQHDWTRYMRANDRKQKIIQKAKRANFRQEIEKVAGTPTGLWRLAKWAKDKSHLPREVPKMPILKHNDQIAESFDEKIDMFKNVFFPAPPPVDLDDIPGSFYPNPVECPPCITENEVLAAIRRSAPDKAPGPDGFTNRLLKACAPIMVKLLTPLFEACIQQAYHPKAYKEANTITLKKPGKGDYTTPKSYRPIALLNTIGKIMESIMSKKIAWLAETHRLLPDTHMGCRKGRSTETALEMLTEQIHTVWGKGTDRVATLLSLDVAGAFDTVSHDRLIHDLRKRKIPMWITDWVNSFLQDRKTTLAVNRRTTGLFPVQTGTPQGSPLSPILYLFYNADLLEMCDRPGINTGSLGYADDVNILAYGKSTDENCRNLERVHRLCERWAARHGSVFAPAKYELIHFTRNPKKFDMTATIRIGSDIIQPKTDIRVLGVQIDTRLKWGPHVRKVQEKMVKQSMALTKLSTSTWGATFRKARVLYTSVVRPAITYGAAVWHDPKEKKTGTISKLAVIQNRCLRSISGAFRATPIAVLEAETHVAPIDIHLDRLQAHARYRMRAGGMPAVIRKACDRITDKLSGGPGRPRLHRPTPGELKRAWAERQLPTIQRPPADIKAAPWADPGRAGPGGEPWMFHRQRKKEIDSFHAARWQQRWNTYCDSVPTPTPAQTGNIDKKRLKLHDQLQKAESSLSTQIRTEKIGLASFLFKRRVPGVSSARCRCGWGNQTIKHVIMFCGLMNDRDRMLRDVGTTDYRQLTASSRRLKIVIKWLLQHDLLPQFALAAKLLYEH
jgi:exonuclease III